MAGRVHAGRDGGGRPRAVHHHLQHRSRGEPADVRYQDLLAPEFKGRIATTELAATTLVAWYTWLEETEGEGFLEQLAAQNPRLYVGAVPLGQAVASGEVIASAFGVPTATQPLIDEGAPLAYSVPDPGLGIRYGMAALGWSQRPNAALVLVDWIMSSEGQQAWHGRGESRQPPPGDRGIARPRRDRAVGAGGLPARGRGRVHGPVDGDVRRLTPNQMTGCGCLPPSASTPRSNNDVRT